VVALFFPLATAIAITALVHLLNNLFKLLVLWRGIDWRITVVFGVPALLATLPGAWLLTHLDVLPALAHYELAGKSFAITPVKLAVGMLLIAFATAEGLSIAQKTHIPTRYLPAGGVLSGFFGGLSGHQGAFRSAFLLHAGLDKNQFVATNAAIASMVDIARLAVYGMSLPLLMDPAHNGMLAIAVLAAFAGVIAGKLYLKKITLHFVQKLVMLMLYALGILLSLGVL